MVRFLIGVLTVLLSGYLPAHGQRNDHVQGKITSVDENEPMVGASVFWLGTSTGTVSDADGLFSIERVQDRDQLVISYIGYQGDTVKVGGSTFLEIALIAGNTLDDVEVVRRKKATEYSFLDPALVQQIDEKELLKAACCNLSESFETNPSVDVAFSDAVTGTRQIQMLGLAGPNIQITRENMPYIRGFSSLYGLTLVPGTWVEGMQLSKGTGSVVNGFESIAGQINIELRKPEDPEKLYLNLYANEGARFEANANMSAQINEGWSTALLLHTKTNQKKFDRNKDGFLDNPLSDHVIATNRWKYMGTDGLLAQVGLTGTVIRNKGGQIDFIHSDGPLGNDLWGMGMDIDRWEGWLKLGKVYEDLPWRSWAVQISGTHHSQDSYFGLRRYDAVQKSLYSNLLYQSIIGNTHHQILMGLSWQYDDYDEILGSTEYDQIESVPGSFFEYTYGGHEKFSFVAGLRGDLHNQYGFFVTPRLHTRYAFNDSWVWRASIGRGLRTAKIISENNGILASQRTFEIFGNSGYGPYGLGPEIAWNIGTNLVYTFQNNQHPGTVSFDFYHTNFQNQIVIDLDYNPQIVRFYNLQGKSYSNSFQAQIDYELHKRLNVRFAYRWYDVKTTYDGTLLEKPLLSRQRLFLNLDYATPTDWHMDYTINWQGRKRLPNTDANPSEYQLDEYSPGFIVMNAQISKRWNKKFEVYIGVENLLNFRQDNPILGAEDPFGEFFDSSLTWGPIFGRNSYLGVRYRL
ncbi:MAG: TonB-dependent receptor [Saprospiraceae bacterium]|nr:TonB-dependent receptor [Saprospiraceae bacterium]